MKSLNSIIWPVLYLCIAHSTNAKSHFTSHSAEVHALHHSKALHPNKRDLLSCEQTYGEGSIPCGGSDSKYCYDPTIGEVSRLFLPHTYCARMISEPLEKFLHARIIHRLLAVLWYCIRIWTLKTSKSSGLSYPQSTLSIVHDSYEL